jgi:hypothetical protein
MSQSQGTEARRPSRRAIAAGAAWAVPVIAVGAAAPALAASHDPCVPTTNFDSLVVGSKPSQVIFLPSMVVATLGWDSTGNNGDTTPGNTGRVAATSTTPSWKYIEIEQLSPLQVGDTVTLTISLSQPVDGLSFIIHDIDSTTNGWRDEVEVLTAGFTYQLGPGLQGNGTAANRFRPNSVGDYPINSGQGDVRLTWAGTVSQVQIRYRAGITGNSGNQHIGLGNLSYKACVFPQAGKQVQKGAGVKVPLSDSGAVSTKSADDR